MQVPKPGSTPVMIKGGADEAEHEEEEAETEGKVSYPSEFQRIYHQGIERIVPVIQEFPLVSLITVVAFTILGISQLFSFNIFTAATLIGLAATLGRGIQKEPSAYWEKLKASFWEVKDMIFQMSGNSGSSEKTEESEKGKSRKEGPGPERTWTPKKPQKPEAPQEEQAPAVAS